MLVPVILTTVWLSMGIYYLCLIWRKDSIDNGFERGTLNYIKHCWEVATVASKLLILLVHILMMLIPFAAVYIYHKEL